MPVANPQPHSESFWESIDTQLFIAAITAFDPIRLGQAFSMSPLDAMHHLDNLTQDEVSSPALSPEREVAPDDYLQLFIDENIGDLEAFNDGMDNHNLPAIAQALNLTVDDLERLLSIWMP